MEGVSTERNGIPPRPVLSQEFGLNIGRTVWKKLNRKPPESFTVHKGESRVWRLLVVVAFVAEEEKENGTQPHCTLK